MFGYYSQSVRIMPTGGAFPLRQGICGYRAKNTLKAMAGFTVMELVMVISILGIVAAFAIPRWQANGAYTVGYQADRLLSDIRYIQSLAMAWGENLRLDVSTGSYQVTCVNSSGTAACGSAGDIITDPLTNQPFNVTLDSGITLAGIDTDFDKLGRPNSSGTLLSGARTFTLSGGSNSWTVSTAPVTGFASKSSP
ncbi:MAG TPA: type II secretion system protein [Sedimenticola sp.]|nr:type II secretion system protein [Sedimenticola sp.]